MAVRQGDLQIYGFGLKPGAKRALRQQVIYTALQRKFGKIFAAGNQAAGLQVQQRQVGRRRTTRAAGDHRAGRLAGDRLLPGEVRQRGDRRERSVRTMKWLTPIAACSTPTSANTVARSAPGPAREPLRPIPPGRRDADYLRRMPVGTGQAEEVRVMPDEPLPGEEAENR